jgi:hypothetical protein
MSERRSDDRKKEDPRAGKPEGDGLVDPAVRRPGPHGAEARPAEEIARSFHRTRGGAFEEIKPRTVTAADAVGFVDDQAESEEAAPRGRMALLKSRACFIATAAYGDPDAPEVESLRRFRDNVLLKSRFGTAFVRFYYAVSPPLARVVARHPRLRTAIRRALDAFRSKAAL